MFGYRGDERTCVDIDECAENSHNCSVDNITCEIFQLDFVDSVTMDISKIQSLMPSLTTLKAISALMRTNVRKDLRNVMIMPLVVI